MFSLEGVCIDTKDSPSSGGAYAELYLTDWGEQDADWRPRSSRPHSRTAPPQADNIVLATGLVPFSTLG